MKYYFPIILLFIAFIFPIKLNGQSVSFKRYSTEDGLPHNVGFDLMQDRKGFMWIGTDNGLVRFDGVQFKTYSIQDGLTSPYIITLSEDKDGTIWIGSYKNHINYLSNDSIFTLANSHVSRIQAPRIFVTQDGSFIYNDEGANRSGLITSIIKRKFGENKKGEYWYKLEESKILSSTMGDRGPKGVGTKNYARDIMNMDLYHMIMYQLKSGDILFASNIGLLKLDNDTTISRVHIPSLPMEYISAIYEDDEGYLWLAMEKKVYKVKSNRVFNVYKLPIGGNRVLKMCKTPSGKIYAMDNKRSSLIRYDIYTKQVEDLLPSLGLKADISYLTCDNESNLWFTTNGDGLYCIYDQRFDNYNQGDGLDNPFVNTISQDIYGNIYAGTKGGLSVYRNGRWSSANRLLLTSPQEVLRLFISKNGDLYGNSATGLHLISHSPQFWPSQSNIYTIDKRDSVWAITTNRGIKYSISDPSRYEVLESQLVNREFTNSKLNFIRELGENQMGFGTTEGLYITDKKLADLAHYTMGDGLPHNQINDMIIDSDSLVWLATEGGISIWDGEQFRNLTTDHGLLSNSCKVILKDERQGIWVGTVRGLHYIRDNQILTYTSHMGLIAEDINCLFFDRDRNLWIGTSLGISVLPNREIPHIEDAPRLYFNSLLIDDSLASFSEEVSISQKQQLEINYSAISYVEPERIRFQYRLKSDAEWDEVQGRKLTLANMQADNYELQIRARKLNSDWNPPVCFSFEVIAPWWQRPISWLLGILIFLVLGGVISWFYLQRLRRKEKAKTLVNKRFAELELQALQAQINPHFIFNALGVIQQFIVENDTETANMYLVRFARLMRMFLDSSKDKYISLDEEIKMLTLYIEMEKLCYEEKFTYSIQVDDKLRNRSVKLPSMLIQPFVENAIHHGLLLKEKPGNLLVDFQLRGKEMVCTVVDDGVGRKKALELKQKSYVSYKSRGMKITEERLKVLNHVEQAQYRLDIQDLQSPGGNSLGTQVMIFIPLGHIPF